MYEYNAKVIRVVDGDTAEVIIDLGFKITREEHVRFARINAPELSTANGKPSKEYLKGLIEGKNVVLKTFKNGSDKYGRYLAEVLLNNENVNDLMIKNGFAVPYMDK